MKELILSHPGMTFALMAVLGAALHWAKKAYRGETSWNPIDYWFADNPMHSAGAAGALAVSVWGVVFSDSLTGMQPHMIVASGFTLGWVLDSGINKAGTQDSVLGTRQGGFIRLALLPILFVLALLAGCGTMGPKPETPKTIPEQIEAASLFIGKLDDTLVSLTCTQFQRGQCVEPGKPVMPEKALEIHGQLEDAHEALVAVKSFGAGQAGECLGKKRSQSACLAAISTLLLQVDRYLIERRP
jgi:hypothetical protein